MNDKMNEKIKVEHSGIREITNFKIHFTQKYKTDIPCLSPQVLNYVMYPHTYFQGIKYRMENLIM